MKRCTACGRRRRLSEFYVYTAARRPDKPITRSVCKACDKLRSAAWHRANPKRAGELNAPSLKVRRATNRDKLARLKAHPCTDCGAQYPACVMEFDHVRGVKLYHIGLSTMGKPNLDAELAKCELRCANCHRLRHMHEREAARGPA